MNKKNTNEATPIKNTRRLRFKAISTALTIAVIIGIILLNVIVGIVAERYPLSWDISSDKVFTLSAESKTVAQATEKEVEVVVFANVEDYFLSIANEIYTYYLYYSGVEVNMANQFERLGREVETALTQLQSASNGKITYTFINPDQEPERYAAYTKYNMGENNVLLISGERHRKTSLGNMFEITDTTSITSLVEKVLVSNIYALQGEEDRIVQVLVGHEEDSSTIAGLKILYELNGYTFEELTITGSAAFNEKTEILLIPAPAKDYSEEEIGRIRTWLTNDNKRNRHLIVYTNPTADCPNLYEMLKTDFSIEVTDQVIYESNADRFRGYDPNEIVADVPENKYTTNAKGTGTVLVPLARRLICDLPSSVENNAIAQLGIPLTTHPDTADVSVIGSKDSKITIEKDEYPLTSTVAYVYEAFDDNTQQEATTTVMVCGSAAMAYPACIQDGTLKNEEFLLDAINTITGYETTISISNKVIAKDVTQFTTGTQLIVGIGLFTVGLPLAVLIVCLVVFLRRRSL